MKTHKAFHFLIDIKRADKLLRIALARGKSVIQLVRDWIDGMRE